MFTGLIEEVGVVNNVVYGKEYTRVRIIATKILRGMRKGDSISVNGVCLTVINHSNVFQKCFRNHFFEVEILHETLKKTSMKFIMVGMNINLERAMRISDRIGGHIVTGHVACTAPIVSFDKHGENYFLWVQMPQKYMRYCITEGTVTIDGISLTIASISKNKIMCNIIPHTFQNTRLSVLKTGDILNIEPDILAKYIERMNIKKNEL